MKTVTLIINCPDETLDEILESIRAVQDTLEFDNINSEIKVEDEH